MTGSSAILLVDHGSRREASNRRLEQLAAELRVRSGRLVEPAHMEIAEPTIAQGLERLVQQGAARVVVVPYFLSPGRHSMEDVPRLAAEAAAAHPGLALRVAPPLGPDERLTRLVLARADVEPSWALFERGPGGEVRELEHHERFEDARRAQDRCEREEGERRFWIERR